LTLKKGQASTILTEICKQHSVQSVYWNRRYEADAIERDTQIKKSLTSKDIEVTSYRANLLSEPWTVETKTGGYLLQSLHTLLAQRKSEHSRHRAIEITNLD